MSEQPVNRLKAAAEQVAAPPFLEARIRHRMQAETAPAQGTARWFSFAVAAAAVVVGLSIAYQLGHLRFTVSSQESYIAAVTNRIATLMRVGLGDHIHCSVFRKFPKSAPKTEDLVRSMGSRYAELIPVVQANVPAGYRMMLAHQCRYGGRRFVHVSLMNEGHLLSLVIAQKRAGESFITEGMLPSLVRSGIPMYQSGVQRFTMTAFETADHLVYYITDLPQQQTTGQMLAMAPAVTSVLERAAN